MEDPSMMPTAADYARDAAYRAQDQNKALEKRIVFLENWCSEMAYRIKTLELQK